MWESLLPWLGMGSAQAATPPVVPPPVPTGGIGMPQPLGMPPPPQIPMPTVGMEPRVAGPYSRETGAAGSGMDVEFNPLQNTSMQPAPSLGQSLQPYDVPQPYGPSTPEGGGGVETPATTPAQPQGGENTPMPRPRPAASEGGQARAEAVKGQGQSTADKLVAAMRGISPPPRPDVVKPSSPHLLRPQPIHGGELLALLNQLTAPSRGAAAQVPMPLGRLLQGR